MVGHLVLGLVLAGTSFLAAVAALLAVHLWLRRGAARRRLAELRTPAPQEDAVLLFDDEALRDACEGGRGLIATLPPGPTDWARFSAWAAPRFPGFAAALAGLATRGSIRLEGAGTPPLVLFADWCDGLARIALHDPTAEGRTVPVDRLSLAAAEQELAQLRRTVEAAPYPIWREEADGAVVWANPAYLQLAAGRDAEAGLLTWPLPQLFAPADDPPAGAGAPGAEAEAPPLARRALAAPVAGGPRWFDCASRTEPGGARLGFALPADAAVRAEAALRDLVQTLSRTFAHLPVGLAVFDRQRRLQLFNPALSDLTTLSPAFLTGRPGFEAFFDALRARQMIPEPRDYRAWRQSLTEMERAAAQGHYQEVWSLTTGQTYRVTGRPHPDGAVAFLIEDVSAEMSLTRRFRAEIETGQAVLDSLPEAIAVFSTAGVLVMANAAYAELWGEAPDTIVGEVGVAEALRLWKSLAHPSPHWAQLRTLIGAGGPRRAWEGAIQLQDGRHMVCRLTPLAGGATMIGFRPAAAARLPLPPTLVEATGLAVGPVNGAAGGTLAGQIMGQFPGQLPGPFPDAGGDGANGTGVGPADGALTGPAPGHLGGSAPDAAAEAGIGPAEGRLPAVPAPALVAVPALAAPTRGGETGSPAAETGQAPSGRSEPDPVPEAPAARGPAMPRLSAAGGPG